MGIVFTLLWVLSALISWLAFFIAFGACLVDLLYRRFILKEYFGIDNILNSLKGTRIMRKYLRFSPKEKGAKEANRYRYRRTFHLVYYDDSAIFTFTTPADIEGSALFEKHFPDIRRKLNRIDNRYIFGDIVPTKGDGYCSKGRYLQS